MLRRNPTVGDLLRFRNDWQTRTPPREIVSRKNQAFLLLDWMLLSQIREGSSLPSSEEPAFGLEEIGGVPLEPEQARIFEGLLLIYGSEAEGQEWLQ